MCGNPRPLGSGGRLTDGDPLGVAPAPYPLFSPSARQTACTYEVHAAAHWSDVRHQAPFA